MKVLVVDIGGTRVKFRQPCGDEIRRFHSGPRMTPEVFIEKVRQRTSDWPYDVVSIGIPAVVAGGRCVGEPGNLGPGWVGFDFEQAFGRPARLVNDAILQALGGYRAGRMLYLGLGTGVGSALVSEHVLVPLELGNLPHPRGGTLFERLGRAARKADEARWLRAVLEITPVLRTAFNADYVMLGGGNGRKVSPLPEATFRGGAQDAFNGGVRLWEDHVEPHDAEPARVWRVVR